MQDIAVRNMPALLIVLTDAITQWIEIIDDDRQFMGINAMFRQLQLNAIRRYACLCD